MQNYGSGVLYRESPSKSGSSQVRDENAQARKSLPISEVLANVKSQIEIGCFRQEEIPQAQELALIIAEVFILPPNIDIRIAGNSLPAETVAEIYKRITHDHVQHVMRNYAKADYEIKHVKTYLRTALYNAVFEITSRIGNEVSADTLWQFKG